MLKPEETVQDLTAISNDLKNYFDGHGDLHDYRQFNTLEKVELIFNEFKRSVEELTDIILTALPGIVKIEAEGLCSLISIDNKKKAKDYLEWTYSSCFDAFYSIQSGLRIKFNDLFYKILSYAEFKPQILKRFKSFYSIFGNLNIEDFHTICDEITQKNRVYNEWLKKKVEVHKLKNKLVHFKTHSFSQLLIEFNQLNPLYVGYPCPKNLDIRYNDLSCLIQLNRIKSEIKKEDNEAWMSPLLSLMNNTFFILHLFTKSGCYDQVMLGLPIEEKEMIKLKEAAHTTLLTVNPFAVYSYTLELLETWPKYVQNFQYFPNQSLFFQELRRFISVLIELSFCYTGKLSSVLKKDFFSEFTLISNNYCIDENAWKKEEFDTGTIKMCNKLDSDKKYRKELLSFFALSDIRESSQINVSETQPIRISTNRYRLWQKTDRKSIPQHEHVDSFAFN